MEMHQELLYVHMTRASANIDSVPRAQGKIESNMAYPDMFVQLATTLGTELTLLYHISNSVFLKVETKIKVNFKFKICFLFKIYKKLIKAWSCYGKE